MRVIPRSEWGARHGRGSAVPRPQSRVVIHHAPERRLSPNATREQVAEQLRIIEDWHARTLTPTNKRIGYQFVAVDQTAEIWEGLGWGRIGAHVANNNTPSLGILILGIDGDRSAGRPETWRAIAEHVREGIRLGHLAPADQLVIEPHRARVATTCPGDVLAAYVERLTVPALLQREQLLDAIPEYEPKLAIPQRPLAPRAAPIRTEPIEIPKAVPVEIQQQPFPLRVWQLRKWAIEVAERIGVEARDRRVSGADYLAETAVHRLYAVVAGIVPEWLLIWFWPAVEAAARRAIGHERG